MADGSALRSVPGSRLVLRRNLSLQPDVYLIPVLLAFVTFAGFSQADVLDQLPAVIGSYVLFIGLEVLVQSRVSITVTASQVIMRAFRRPRVQAVRSQVHEIRMYSMGVRLMDADHESLMSGSRYWRKAQILCLARELDVPFYDHRKWWCMADRDEGRLVYQPN
jgi:hypothetical protein